ERMKRRQQDEKRACRIETNFNAFLEIWEALPLFRNPSTDEKALNRYHQNQRKNRPGQMAMSLRGFGTGKMPPIRIEKIEKPILFLAGAKDDKYVNIMRAMNRKSLNSELHIIPKAAHRVHLDRPRLISKHIQKF